MELNFNDDQRYTMAKERVEKLKEFYGHVASYVGVMIILVVINLLTSPEHLWFFWPMLGWGIGLFFHAMKVYDKNPFFGKEWEERKMKQFMEEEKRNASKWQ